MKVQAHDNTLETNSESESKGFGIGDPSVVIEILRNRLYENKIQTLCQEYICNARDAMREVGKGNDFEITVPTRLSPTFKVRDFGPGITPDRMDNVFRLYGASTKRNTNNQTGGFGIGAKSAWSYTDSFTVVTVVDGTRRTYVCHTGHNNQGSLDLVTVDHTDEPNGTEIQVGVKLHDIKEFVQAVFRAIYFWADRPNVKGTSDLPKLVTGYKVSDNIETIDLNKIPSFIGLGWSNKALAVIDGIPYPLTEKLRSKAANLDKFICSNLRESLILHFGNGIVEVSASRESIADSQFSIENLNKMGTSATKLVFEHIKDRFSKVKSVSDWLETYRSLDPYFSVDSHSTFGNYKIEFGSIVCDDFINFEMTFAHCLDKRKRFVVERITKEPMDRLRSSILNHIPVELLDQVFLVTKEETAIVQNKRLREYFKGKQAELSKVILLNYKGDVQVADKIVAELGIKNFESIEYTEKPKAERVKVEREYAEFCMHGFGSIRHIYTTLKENTDKYLYVSNRDNTFNANDLKELSWHLKETEGLVIVGLGDRALKMVQGNENFTPFSEWLANFKPNKAQINFAICQKSKNSHDMEALLELTGIKDEFLTSMIKEYKEITSGKRKVTSVPDLLIEKVKEACVAKEFLENDEKLTKLLEEKYPLVKEIGRYSSNKNELTFYINAKYSN